MGNDGRHTPDATHGSSAPWSAPGDALTAAEQDRIYEAALDAVMVRQLAIWLSGSQVVSILPIVGIVGLAGYFVLLAAVPGMALRWFLRHGRLDSRNPDIVTARRRLALAMVV